MRLLWQPGSNITSPRCDEMWCQPFFFSHLTLCEVARAAPHEMVRMRDGAQGQIGHPGEPPVSGATTFYTAPHTLYWLLRNAPSSVKLTQLQSVNRSQDLRVSSIINEAEEMLFLRGSSWTFFDNCCDILLRLWTPNSAFTTSQMPFNKEMGLKIF